MALISLDYMQFYVPPSQAFEPGLSAQKMPPASSVAASSTTVAVSVGGHEGQNAEARPRDEEAAPTDFEMGSLRAGTTDAGPSDEPTASTESVEHVQDGEGRRGSWIEIDEIVPPSCCDDDADDGFFVAEELFFSDGESAARPSGSQDKPIVIEDDGKDRDVDNAESHTGDSDVGMGRDISCTPPTSVASSGTRTSPTSARKGATGHGEDSSLVEEGAEDKGGAVNAGDATGSDIEEAGHTDVEGSLHDATEGANGVASTVLSAKRKLPHLATGGSAKSHAMPQHRRKRCRYHFLAPAPPNEELETGDESSGSINVRRRPTPQRKRPLEEFHEQRPRPEPSGHQDSSRTSGPSSSRTAPPRTSRVVFEQQRWEGEIIDERRVGLGPGRPRVQFLIKWEPSWVDKGRLAAPALIENWEGMGHKNAEGL